MDQLFNIWSAGLVVSKVIMIIATRIKVNC